MNLDKVQKFLFLFQFFLDLISCYYIYYFILYILLISSIFYCNNNYNDRWKIS